MIILVVCKVLGQQLELWINGSQSTELVEVEGNLLRQLQNRLDKVRR